METQFYHFLRCMNQQARNLAMWYSVSFWKVGRNKRTRLLSWYTDLLASKGLVIPCSWDNFLIWNTELISSDLKCRTMTGFTQEWGYSVLGFSLGGLSVHAIASAKASAIPIKKTVDSRILWEATSGSPWGGEKNKYRINSRVWLPKFLATTPWVEQIGLLQSVYWCVWHIRASKDHRSH